MTGKGQHDAETIIQVEGLCKQYRLGTINHGTLAQDIQSWWARVRGKEDPNLCVEESWEGNATPPQKQNPAQHDVCLDRFWALRDVSFEVRRGEVLGIIGTNGAGKSTLLKILSRITAPTRGQIKIWGRISSLLEVGTGFHPELTGRENVFLNGAILGMTKSEIRQRFSEIVDFSGVEKFIDTPVKRYSSGMYVRLAFAVAAHLEPEILIVDEVLAVGDAEFQRKCLGKMAEIGQQGRTVLFVSHNMAAVEKLCNTGILLHDGANVFQGEISQAVARYLRSFEPETGISLARRTDRKGRGQVRISQFDIADQSGHKNIPFPIGAKLLFEIHYCSQQEVRHPRVIIGLYDDKGIGIARFDTDLRGDLQTCLPQNGRFICATDELNITPGRYFVNIALSCHGEMEDYIINAAIFEVVGSDYFNSGRIFNEHDSSLAKVLVRHTWSVSA